jgi:hypothetical protein
MRKVLQSETCNLSGDSRWGSPLKFQDEKYQGEKACDKRDDDDE